MIRGAQKYADNYGVAVRIVDNQGRVYNVYEPEVG
jgi:hypothetical protein